MKKWKIGVLFLWLMIVCGVPLSANAATLEQREACKQKMMEMLRTAETEPQTISEYRVTGSEVDELFAEIRHGDGAELCGGYYPATDFIYTVSFFGGYVRTIQLVDVNADALTRYEQMVPVIDSIIAGLEDDMSDLDKIIYLHDAIVEMTDYKVLDSKTIFTASGVFLERKAVCAGYAKAFNVLLRRIGLETSYVASASLNHGWSYVKLDGEWYHVDSTWDDTRTPVAGQVSRANLLRNDKEFSKNHSTWEVKVIDETSESAKYESWLVHDVVGDMIFENGRWYYLDTKDKTVVALDAVNNSSETLFSYADFGSVAMVDVLEDRIILSVNGKEISQTAEQWEAASIEDKEEVQITPDAGVVEDVMMSPNGGLAASLDFSDISCWRTGHYDTTYGAYCLNRRRICLNDLIENTEDRYAVTIGHWDYKVVIVEYNARKKIIGSAELGDGEVYVPSEGTIYLGVSIFNSVQSDWTISYETYEEMFSNGLVVGFNFCVEEEKSANGVEEEPGSPIDFSDISYWRTGHYDTTCGAYCLNRRRICLNDLIENTEKGYAVTIGNRDYKVVIVEYNARKKIMGSAELGDGEVYVPSEGTMYLGVSIFNSVQSDWRISYETYEEMFANGLVVGFNLGAEE